MSRARDLADSADKDIAGTLTLDGLSVSGDVAVNTDTLFVDVSADSVGIGTSSPSNPLQVEKSSTDTTITNAQNSNALKLSNYQGGSNGQFSSLGFSVAAASGASADAVIAGFADSAGNSSLRLYTEASNVLSERMRIDSSGNLLVGKTSTSSAIAGTTLWSGGATDHTASGTVLGLNRLSTDGDIATFKKDGTTVGSIGTTSGVIHADSAGSAVGIHLGGAGVLPRKSGALNDAGVDLGSSSRRFKDLYLSGGVYLGGTGSANYLDDYEEGTWTPTYGGGTNPSGVTYDQQIGFYVKIGRLVTLAYKLGTDAISSVGSGTLRLSGLPFTVSDVSIGSGSVLAYLWATSPNTPILFPNSGTTYAQFYKNDNAASGIPTSYLGTGANANRAFGYLTYYTSD